MLLAWLITPPLRLQRVVAITVIIYQLSGVPDTKNKSKGHWCICMNIFASLRQYAGKWSVKSSRDFSQEEINAVRDATVVPSQYGNSVCFMMVGGGQTFIPLSNDSSLSVGERVDLTKAKLLTLGKDGENDILRVSI